MHSHTPRPLHSRFRLALMAGSAFAVLGGYVLWPLLLVAAESLKGTAGGPSLDPWRRFMEKGHWVFALRSVGVSLATIPFAGVLGTGLAFFYARLEFPGRRVFAALTLLPFTLPPLVGVFAVWSLLAEGGPADHLVRTVAGRGFFIEKGWTGVLIVHAYSMYVYYFVMAGDALRGLDESRVEAARNLGAGPWTVLFRVTLPRLAPALAGATLLTVMTSMASFTAPYYYMAGRPVLTQGLQEAIEDSDSGLAGAGGVVLALASAAFLLVILRFDRAFEGGVKGAPRRPRPLRGPIARWGAAGSAAAVTLLLLAPHLAMLRDSLVLPGTGFVGKPAEYGLENYARILRTPDAWRPLSVSFRASAAAAAAVVLFAMLTAWLERRRRFAGRGILRALVMLPWALPGTLIAAGLLWMTRRPGPLTFGFDLRGTIAILGLAYFIRLIPLGHRTLSAALAGAPEELEWAARDLGATPARAYLRVTLPLIAGAVLAASALVFTTAMGEFVSSILLHGPGTEPVAVRIDELRRGPGGVHSASAYGVVLTALITFTFLLAGRRSGAGTTS